MAKSQMFYSFFCAFFIVFWFGFPQDKQISDDGSVWETHFELR